MKKVFVVILILAILSAGYNAFNIDLDSLLVGKSKFALFGLILSICVGLLCAIMITSYRIKEKQEG